MLAMKAIEYMETSSSNVIQGAINMGVYDIPNGKLRVGPVTRVWIRRMLLIVQDDAFTAIKRLPKSVSPAELKRFEDWTKEFGENGSQ